MNRKWKILCGGWLSILAVFGLIGSATAAVTGAQSAISLTGLYSWDYTMDLYNGTTGALITETDYKWADMNATDWNEGVGDYTFTHTFAGNVSAWYNNENNADQILQSYWFYFPEDYEDDTNNITIFVHWGVVGTGFLSYVWFMNFTCYMAYHWTNLTHPDSTSNLVQNDPVNFVDSGFSIETTIVNTAFVATGNWSGALTIASITGTSGTFDFWPEYTTEAGTGRNLLADRAAAQPAFQVFVNLFDGVFGDEGGDTEGDDDTGDLPGGGSSSSDDESVDSASDTTEEIVPVADPWILQHLDKIFLAIAAAIIALVIVRATSPAENKPTAKRTPRRSAKPKITLKPKKRAPAPKRAPAIRRPPKSR